MRALFDQALCQIKASAKAIGGVVGFALAGYAARVGLDLGPAPEIAIGAFVGGLVVWFVRNRKC